MRAEPYKITLATFLILVLACAGTTAIGGELEKEENITAQPPDTPVEPVFDKPTGQRAEQIDRILAEMKKNNPQKAEELSLLREKDPNAFRLELRKSLREKSRKEMTEQMGGRRGVEPMRKEGPHREQGPWMGRGGPEMMWEWMQEKHEEYMKWLAENYPDDATKLNELKDEDPEQYMRAVMVSGRKYWPIFQASKDNPRLASVLKEQLALREKRAALIKQIKTTADEKEKAKLTADLENIVAQSFDLIVRRKQLACEDMAKKLTELQKELDLKKAEIEKWKTDEFKNAKVKHRINELLSQNEEFQWE